MADPLVAQEQLTITLDESSLQAQQQGFESVIDATRDLDDRVSLIFVKVILANPAFIQTLSVQDILATKGVSRSFRFWFADNENTIARARRQDQSRDWYFPIFVDAKNQLITLFGMSHDLTETKLRKLPFMTSLPRPSSCVCNPTQKEIYVVLEDLLASSGGLLLFRTGRRSTLKKHTIVCKDLIRRNESTLIVINPLMTKPKELPSFEGGFQQFSRTCEYLIMVDDITNSYKVLVLWCIPPSSQHRAETKLVVYDSRFNNWGTIRTIHPLVQPEVESWTNPCIYSAIYTRGRLYVADVDYKVAAIRLFEVDIETGQWKMCTKYHNPNWQLSRPLMMVNTLTNRCTLQLVECMGHLYAVIPADYHPSRIEAISNHLKYMSDEEFYIFQLEGDVRREWVLRSERLWSTNNLHILPLELPSLAQCVRPKMFSCTTKGSVIWVNFANRLLHLDVHSGKCKTEVVPNYHGGLQAGLTYRASFHMKP